MKREADGIWLIGDLVALAEFWSARFSIQEDGRVHIVGLKDIPPTLIENLRRRKDEVLAYLKAKGGGGDDAAMGALRDGV